MRGFTAHFTFRQHRSVLTGGQQVADSDHMGTVRDGQTGILNNAMT